MKYDTREIGEQLSDAMQRTVAEEFALPKAIATLRSKLAPPETVAILAAADGAAKRQRKKTSEVGIAAKRQKKDGRKARWEKEYKIEKTGRVSHDAALKRAAKSARVSEATARRFAKALGLRGAKKTRKSTIKPAV